MLTTALYSEEEILAKVGSEKFSFWLNEAKKIGSTKILIFHDNFDNFEYPHYLLNNENEEEKVQRKMIDHTEIVTFWGTISLKKESRISLKETTEKTLLGFDCNHAQVFWGDQVEVIEEEKNGNPSFCAKGKNGKAINNFEEFIFIEFPLPGGGNDSISCTATFLKKKKIT